MSAAKTIITSNNLVQMTLSNYGFYGNNFINRKASLEYPAGQGPLTYHTASGTAQGRGDQVNFPETASTCANDDCHSLSKADDVATFEPACSSCHPDRVVDHGP